MSGIRRRWRRRGRPPHPDVLTPAEWRVLEHLRRGLPNAAIANRLGITVNTVKTHVASMLAKLQLTDRRELAAWTGQPATGKPPAGIPLLDWLGPRVALTAKVIAVVATGAALVVAVSIVVALARRDDAPSTNNGRTVGLPTADTTVAPIPSPTVPPTPMPTPDGDVPDDITGLTLGEPLPFPDDLEVMVELGCSDCDTPTASFARIYRDATGEVRVETLFELSAEARASRIYIHGATFMTPASAAPPSTNPQRWGPAMARGGRAAWASTSPSSTNRIVADAGRAVRRLTRYLR